MHLGQLLSKCPVENCEGYVVFAGRILHRRFPFNS